MSHFYVKVVPFRYILSLNKGFSKRSDYCKNVTVLVCNRCFRNYTRSWMMLSNLLGIPSLKSLLTRTNHNKFILTEDQENLNRYWNTWWCHWIFSKYPTSRRKIRNFWFAYCYFLYFRGYFLKETIGKRTMHLVSIHFHDLIFTVA